MAFNFDQEEQHHPYAASSSSVDERAVFITRTYMHLLGAIVLFTLLEIFYFTSGFATSVSNWIYSSGGFMWLAVLGGFMAVSWIATMFASSESSKGAQYFGLSLYVVGESLIFIPLLYMAEMVGEGLIESAAGITLVGFAALTAIVFITRKDFSFMRGILMWAGILAIIAILASVIFGMQLGVWFSVGMVALAGGSILYSTSNILHHYPTTHYVAAAVSLFASLALMFWYVLRLVISFAGDD